MGTTINTTLQHARENKPAVLFYAALTGSLVLRSVLLFLPAPGRDEAAYYYWSRHFEPAYSFLLQLLVRLFTFLPIPELVALRLPSFLGGILVLVLVYRILQNAGLSRSGRRGIVAALALTPWQIYVGSILHPDSLFLCILLLGAIAAWGSRFWLFALCIGLTVLAKPTGLVILVAGSVYILFLGSLTRTRQLALIAGAFLVASPGIASLDRSMVEAMGEFGRISSDIPAIQIVAVVLAAFFGLSGLFLPLAAVHGIQANWKHAVRQFRHPDKDSVLIWFGGAILATFVSATVFRSQIKANWILTGFVLLLPLSQLHRHRRLMVTNALVSTFLGVGMVLCLVYPNTLTVVGRAFGFIETTYAPQAGKREARISTTSTWRDRVSEYHPMDEFQDDVESFWSISGSETKRPMWLICDDYGLAAQLIFGWNKCATKLVIPGDGVFSRSYRRGIEDMEGRILVVAVHGPVSEIWPLLPPVLVKETTSHPVTGSPIEVAITDIAADWPEVRQSKL